MYEFRDNNYEFDAMQVGITELVLGIRVGIVKIYIVDVQGIIQVYCILDRCLSLNSIFHDPVLNKTTTNTIQIGRRLWD